MSFSAPWLALREPADLAARDPGLLAAARDYLHGVAEPWAVDLGCGTGATVRAFGSPRARWRLIDRDTALLSEAAECVRGQTYALDLGAVDRLPFEGARLVTASALLDLMPGAWIEALADRLAQPGIAAYMALSYDGRMEWTPPRPGDEGVRAAFNRHQLGDKGLGPALGPMAARAFARAMLRRGYHVSIAPSPWRLGPGDSDLRCALTEGIAAAAAETGVETGPWAQARRASSGSGSMLVGHLDVLAVPPGIITQSKITSVASP